MQTIIQYHCTLKVTKSKTRYQNILWSNIYAKLLLLHALTRYDTTSSINGVGICLRYLKTFLSNKHLQEAALVFTASSKSFVEIELAGEKSNIYYFQGRHRPFPKFPTPQTTYLESNYSKILRQIGNTTSNRISFKVP